MEKLRNGVKFDEVAREFSEDKARQGMFNLFFFYMAPRVVGRAVGSNLFVGGSLGWKVRGSLDAAFEKAAYDLEPSSTGNPKYVEVKSGHGYHIIMVEGRR